MPTLAQHYAGYIYVLLFSSHINTMKKVLLLFSIQDDNLGCKEVKQVAPGHTFMSTTGLKY